MSTQSTKPILLLSLFSLILILSQAGTGRSESLPKPDHFPSEKQIYLALLLDTSNSMDGLINQAKSQLWNIVDELADAKHDGKPARLNIALYEYGNDNLSVISGYVRQITPFTTDLDEISSQLFALKTNGGSEYCGAVIKHSLSNLTWGDHDDDLKLIFIAGNEPFNQGNISFQSQCGKASAVNIQVNTIFCGNYQEGINGLWKKGAEIGRGKYLNIDMDQQTVFVATPYDGKIDQLNDELNDTYLAYGATGRSKKAQQLQEDQNAASFSQSNKVKRAISKSKHVYRNEQWDLVDAHKEGSINLSAIPTEDLPEEMKNMSLSEKQDYIAKKDKERRALQVRIKDLGLKRSQYIKAYQDSLSIENPLEYAILESVKEVATKKAFSFEK